MLRLLAVGIVALAMPLAALASAIVESLKGDVQAGGAPIFQGQRLFPGSTITTGAGAQVFLRFDDGMQIVLNENSLLRLVDFTFSTGGRLADRVVVDLLRGAARVSTGAIVAKNAKEFYFRTPQAQIGVQGPADFTVALVNPAYIAVTHGTVLASNGAGTVALGAGSNSIVANSATLATPAPPSSFPPTASSAMNNLNTAALTPPGTAPGAPGAAGAPGIGAPMPLIGAVAIIAAISAAADKDEDPTPPSHH